ncbi:mRNA-decapping enzyme 1B-like [Ctenodactylus gundi]
MTTFQMLCIYGIWFYDKEECQRIAELMKNLTQYEQLKAHQGAGAGVSPVVLSAGRGREVDILQMLTKAKDEYTQCKMCSEPKQMTSSSAIFDNPNLIKPIPVKPSGSQQQHTPPPSQTLDPEHQHLSLTALFGKQNKATVQEPGEPTQALHQQQQEEVEKLPAQHGVVPFLSYEEPTRPSPSVEKQLCPAIQKLMVRTKDLRPPSELPEQWPYKNSSPHPVEEGGPGPGHLGASCLVSTACTGQNISRTQKLLEKIHSASEPTSKPTPSIPAIAGPAAPNSHRTPSFATPGALTQGLAQPQLLYFSGSLAPQTLEHQAHGQGHRSLPDNQASCPGVVSPQELLRRLQVVQQEQQLQMAPRPTLAAKFPVVIQYCTTGKPVESWMGKTSCKTSSMAKLPLWKVSKFMANTEDGLQSQVIPLHNEEKLMNQLPSKYQAFCAWAADTRAVVEVKHMGTEQEELVILEAFPQRRVPSPWSPLLSFVPEFCLPYVFCCEQGISSQHIPAPVAPSLLMSPLVFTQAACASPRDSNGRRLPLQSPEPSMVTSSPLSRLQLQEALLYLIQNDDNFLSIIYEAYLFSVTRAAMKKAA